MPDAVWARTQLLYLCSPGNPTGEVTTLDEWRALFALSDRHGFVIASDECYSEIYGGDGPPLGSLEAADAARPGRLPPRLIAFTSLSKRSNVPGMRSGFVAGDGDVLAKFLLYRTYHGSAMSATVQRASIAAWNDEEHVAANRALYQAKFERVTPMLAEVLDVRAPEAGFYLWAKVPGGDDLAFARDLLAQYNVTVLPGSLLARDVRGGEPRRRARPLRARGRSGLDARSRRENRFLHPRSRFRSMTPTLQSIIDLAWEGRASLDSTNSPEVRDAVEQVIDGLDDGSIRVAEKRGVGDWTVKPVGEEGGAAELSPERQPADAGRRPVVLRQGGHEVFRPRCRCHARHRASVWCRPRWRGAARSWPRTWS